MSEKSKGPLAFDPSVAVDAALTKLEEFTAQNAQEPFPHVYPFIAGRAHPIKEQVGLLTSCIASIFSEKIRKKHTRIRQEKQDELLNAISILKSHYPYIYQLEQESLTHQALAQRFISTIKKFNAIVDLNSERFAAPRKGSLWHALRSYLCRLGGLSITQELIANKIVLPNRKNIEKNAPPKLFNRRLYLQVETPDTHRVFHLFQSKKIFVHPQDIEVFWMKALSLLRSKKVYFESMEEELSCIKQSPISENLVLQKAHWTLEMKQTISPFHGENYVVIGQFIKQAPGNSRGLPVPNSFSISSLPTQTGFPHAAQYTGWGLSEVLIPKCPHRLDLLPQVSAILKNQYEIANRLTLEADGLIKAKQIYYLRKKVFQKNLETFLALHERLSLSLLSALPADTKTFSKQQTIQYYYATLKQQAHPFDLLSETYHLMMEQLVNKPYLALQNAWMKEGTLGFYDQGAARQILEREMAIKYQEMSLQAEKIETEMEKAVLDFIGVVGPLLAVPSITIMLQEFSEMMGFEPPCLDSFAQKIQAATYRQALFFHSELQIDLSSSTVEDKLYASLKEQLLEDIHLFSKHASRPYSPLVEELRQYFAKRHASRKN